MAPETKAPRFFLLLLAGAAVLLALVLDRVAGELLLAAVLAGVLWPVQRWLAGRLGDRPNLAAGLLTIGVIVLLVGPAAGLIAVVLKDGGDGLAFLAHTAKSPAVAELIARLPEAAQRVAHETIAAMPRDLGDAMGLVGQQGEAAATAVSAAVAATGTLVFDATLTLIALFFMLVHGRDLVHWLDSVSPLRPGQTHELLAMFKQVSYAVVVATVITSAVQAAAALIGYLIARVPNPTFFTMATFFMAFIPAVGAAVVCLVCAGLLVLTGHPYLAIFLAVWGVVVVGLVDNVVRPLLIRRGMEIHGAVMFFALIGGLAAFGALGLVIGPIAISLMLALIRIYHRDYSPERAALPRVPGLHGDAAADPG
jgi:predicted PurR-regulated permease PerM